MNKNVKVSCKRTNLAISPLSKMYLKGRWQRAWNLAPAGFAPTWLQQPRVGQAKATVRNSTQISQVGGRHSSMSAIACCFPSTLEETCIRDIEARTPTSSSLWDAGDPSGSKPLSHFASFRQLRLAVLNLRVSLVGVSRGTSSAGFVVI